MRSIHALLVMTLALTVGCSGELGGTSGDDAASATDSSRVEEESDTAAPEPDADIDEAAVVVDSGVATEDSAVDDTGSATDTGSAAMDTGSAVVDTGTMDTGSGATDTGSTVKDTGTVVTDTGSGVKDTGTVMTDSGATAACSVTLAGATGKEPGGMIPVCCAPGATDKTAIMEVFRLVNEHRAANGKPALVYDDKLEAAIQGHCEHMRTHSFFSHTAPESVIASFTTRASKCGTSAGGENIAWGYSTAAQVMDGWKKSAGHNANMLGSWKRMAVGKSGTYWGQLFAN